MEKIKLSIYRKLSKIYTTVWAGVQNIFCLSSEFVTELKMILKTIS